MQTFERVKHLANKSDEINELLTEETMNFAAEIGDIRVLRYLHEEGCPWSEETCYRAALNGHLECLQYLHEEGCPWDERSYCNDLCSEYLKQQMKQERIFVFGLKLMCGSIVVLGGVLLVASHH